MLLATDDKKLAEVETDLGSAPTVVESDGPPPYDAARSPPFVPTYSTRIPFRPRPAVIQSSNYVKIIRKHSSNRGTYVIDAGLRVPDDILTNESEDRETGASGRKNLYLESTHGSTSADVWLVDDSQVPGRNDSSAVERKRAELELKSKHGSVNMKLDSTTTRPFALTASSKHGWVSVAIPSDFVGPVTLTASNWSVSLPGRMKTRLVTFSEESGTRNCFVGDYKKAGYTGKQDWTGSTIDIGSEHGKLTLYFIDEEAKARGFWCKLFSA